MGSSIGRTQFLRCEFSGRTRPIRPPWSLPENEFVERCTRCGDCSSECPQHIPDKGIAHSLPDMHEVDPSAVVGGWSEYFYL